MTREKWERRLVRAVEKTAPDDLDGILSRCETQKGTGSPMNTNTARKTPARPWRAMIAACLALFLLAGGGGVFYRQAMAVSSVVSLDVNPSIELRVNRGEKVLSCTALNGEAREILADMDGGADLKGTKLDVAVNAIVGSLVRRGYLDRVSSAILISVEDQDETRAQRLQQELTDTVGAALQSESREAAVLSQTVDGDSALAAQARESGVSTGKAALIRRVQAVNSALDFDALAALSVEELRQLLEAGAPALPIGCAAARKAAEDCAGFRDAAAGVDPELDEGCYEVELHHPSLGELDYRVDAYTGSILSGQRNAGQADAPAASAVGIERAKAAALKHAGLSASSVTFTKAEQDWDDGHLEYDIEFRSGDWEYDYTVSASGAVLDWEREPLDGDDDRPVSTPSSADIGAEAALSAALGHAGVARGAVRELEYERDWEDGRLVYEIEFLSGGTEYEYTVSAADGSILRHETEADD